MAEYLDRQELLKALVQVEEDYFPDEDPSSYSTGWIDGYAAAVNVIFCVRAADVEPVRRGTWKPTEVPFMNECEDCSVCGYRAIWGHGFSDCPHCGAKMEDKNAQDDASRV